MQELFEIYKKLLLIHIQTKTVDLVFHEASAKFYDLLFSMFHEISEKRQDIELDEPIDCEAAKNEAYELLEESKVILEEMIEEDNTYGMDDLLRSRYNDLEFALGTARGFTTNEDV